MFAAIHARRLVRWYGTIGTDHAIAVAQMRELRRQVPLLYAMLIVDAAIVMFLHDDATPPALTIGVPGILIAVSALRLVRWLGMRDEALSPECLRRRLRSTTWRTGLLATAFCVWSLLLRPYGTPIEQANIALFISVTTLGCIFCLVHLPQAALLVALSAAPPFIIYLATSPNSWFAPITIDVMMVQIVLMRVLFNNFDSFRAFVRSQAELTLQHAELTALSATNAHLALTDSLTGLPNRRAFSERLHETIVRGTGAPIVGLIDLDRFKPVNDRFGYATGDMLLVALADRLRATLPASVMLARLGGDEFGILAEGGEACALITRRIDDALKAPFLVGGNCFDLDASTGLASCPDAAASADELLSRADRALRHGKSGGGGLHTIFSPELEAAARDAQAIESALTAADLRNEIDVHLQPILDIASGRIFGAEALARWRSPDLGMVPPDKFIPLAERTGRIHAITLAIVQRSLELAGTLPTHLSISINISACDLHSPRTVERLAELVLLSGVDPSRIWIEVTETAVMRDIDVAIGVLGRLRRLGLKVALDDFGTGYSSLSHLGRLPLDKVKIDRSFIADLEQETNANIVGAILAICAGRGLDCVAEGVETHAQLDHLRGAGCAAAQGYLFSPPVTADRFRALTALNGGVDDRPAPDENRPDLGRIISLPGAAERIGQAQAARRRALSQDNVSAR